MYKRIAIALEKKTLKDDLIDVQFMPEKCPCEKLHPYRIFKNGITY